MDEKDEASGKVVISIDNIMENVIEERELLQIEKMAGVGQLAATHLDAIGLDLGLRVQDAVLPNICAEKEGNPYLKEMIDNGNIGVQSGKGFFDWNERNIESAIIRRDRFILEAVKILRNLEIESEE